MEDCTSWGQVRWSHVRNPLVEMLNGRVVDVAMGEVNGELDEF